MTTANKLRRAVIGMVPVTQSQICREWANKVLSSRSPLCCESPDVTDEIPRYMEQQTTLIEGQAPIAAAAWARRRGDDPDEILTAELVATIAHGIAFAIAAASRIQSELDQAVADRLDMPPESP